MPLTPAPDAQNRVPVALLRPAGVYGTGPNGQVSLTPTDNVALSKTNVTERGTLKRLEIGAMGLLGRVGAADPTGVAADSGVLRSDAVVNVNMHVLPANFGPGRGRWTQADVDALDVLVAEAGDSIAPSAGAIRTNARPSMFSKALVGADLQVTVHNPSVDAGGMALDARNIHIRLEWRPGAER